MWWRWRLKERRARDCEHLQFRESERSAGLLPAEKSPTPDTSVLKFGRPAPLPLGGRKKESGIYGERRPRVKRPDAIGENILHAHGPSTASRRKWRGAPAQPHRFPHSQAPHTPRCRCSPAREPEPIERLPQMLATVQARNPCFPQCSRKPFSKPADRGPTVRRMWQLSRKRRKATSSSCSQSSRCCCDAACVDSKL